MQVCMHVWVLLNNEPLRCHRLYVCTPDNKCIAALIDGLLRVVLPLF